MGERDWLTVSPSSSFPLLHPLASSSLLPPHSPSLPLFYFHLFLFFFFFFLIVFFFFSCSFSTLPPSVSLTESVSASSCAYICLLQELQPPFLPSVRVLVQIVYS